MLAIGRRFEASYQALPVPQFHVTSADYLLCSFDRLSVICAHYSRVALDVAFVVEDVDSIIGHAILSPYLRCHRRLSSNLLGRQSKSLFGGQCAGLVFSKQLLVGCESFFLDCDRRLVDLGRQVAEVGEGLSRLYASIEAGTIDGTDPMLKERVAALKATRDRALEALDYAKKSSALPIEVDIEVDPVAVDRFTRLMREQLVSGDVAARKAYLSAIVDAIIVSDTPSASSARTIISGPP